MASVFKKLSEEDLEDLTEEEREGYEEELAAYSNPDGSGDGDGEGEGDGSDAGAAGDEGHEGDEGNDERQNIDLDKELAEHEKRGAPSHEEGAGDGDGEGEGDDPDEELKNVDPLPDLGTLREDIKTQQELKQELAEKFDNGDIGAQEKAAQERKIDDQIYALQSDLMRREIKVDAAKENWVDKHVPAFLEQHPAYGTGTGLKKVLNQHVMDLQRGDFASNPFHPNILKLAQKKMAAEFPDTFAAEKGAKDPANKDGGKKPGKPAPKREMPPSLRNVPAAAGEDIGGDGSEFAFLDRLADTDIEKYEDALAKLTPADLDRYMNS